MDQLIPVDYGNPERPTVSGRELHKFLQIETPYAKWFGRMVEYGFTEGKDFVLVAQKCATNNPRNPVKNDRVDSNIFYNAIFYSIHPIQTQALPELL